MSDQPGTCSLSDLRDYRIVFLAALRSELLSRGVTSTIISPGLLDALPVIPAILTDLPAKLRRRLYQAFDISIVYKDDTGQATFRATITTSTPATVTAIIHDSHHPAGDTSGLTSDSQCVPITTPNV